MIRKLKELILRHFTEMRWSTIVTVLLAYCLISWLLLSIAGEESLLKSSDFIYWLIVTSSTVGYGDQSPETNAGKLVVALYVIPFGLSIFALIIGRIASWFAEQWRKGVKGLKHLDIENHMLIIGWNGPRTIQLLRLLLREREAVDDQMHIVLCVRADIENPMPDKIKFVKVESFNNDEDMDRASIAKAKVIIIDNPDDDLTMTSSLYVSHRNPNAHILAYFNDESLVRLLTQHCPNVECMPSVAVEMLSKSAFDPGSSVLHHDLLNVDDEGQAQFSANIPEEAPNLSVETLFTQLKKQYGATLIGLAEGGLRQKVTLNPPLELIVKPGDKVYYIAPERIKNIQWTNFNV
ncbi:potassium channel protein [Paraneptunicella aestuarii]|uniref:potassium channel protein n=1 Tax=Paraneptunicella aestuarii TaxID=2831148 RepID=UPI001E653266|nr:potassium channel family protein [Paraneptunicella aestuarii]